MRAASADARLRGRQFLTAGAVVAGLVGSVVAAVSLVPTSLTSRAVTPSRSAAFGPFPSVFMAEQEARDLGPVPANLKLSASLSLKERNQALLDGVLAHSGRVTPAGWATRFGPAPALVANLRRALAGEGVATSWRPGQVALALRAPSGLMERVLGVAVHDFKGANSIEFYAPIRAPGVPARFRGSVTAVTGLTDYAVPPPTVADAVMGADGVTPAQMTTFYDIGPLRQAGLDGSGETVMFPELAAPPPSVLDAFAKTFHLPAFHATYLSDPPAWGAPLGPTATYYSDAAAEASLDLEVVHGLAPGAKEVVYKTAGGEPFLSNVISAMIKRDPRGIISSSLGEAVCVVDPGYDQEAKAESAVFEPAAAEGTSIMWASGDRGAHECNAGDDDTTTENVLSVLSEDNSPYVTSVGGTIVFLSTTGAYYKEAAWGEPMEQWGGGGGFSASSARPSWQNGPGLAAVNSRGIPDVSADADSNSGWAIFAPGPSGQPLEEPAGGTSAAAPCWAAVTALIDEDLARQELPSVGFADPALYYFASGPKGLPAPAFHDITEGTNLYYAAVPGWDAATGLGSPDVAHLADDFEWYYHTHQEGAP